MSKLLYAIILILFPNLTLLYFLLRITFKIYISTSNNLMDLKLKLSLFYDFLKYKSCCFTFLNLIFFNNFLLLKFSSMK